MRISIALGANGCASEQQPRRQVKPLDSLSPDERGIGRNGDPFRSSTAFVTPSFTRLALYTIVSRKKRWSSTAFWDEKAF
jgi:hypothetical protein